MPRASLPPTLAMIAPAAVMSEPCDLVRTGWIGTRFVGEQPLFRVRRRDRTHSASVTVSHRAVAWKGYLPELTLDWTRTDSNIPIHDRQSRTLRLGLRRLF